jgi:hypothetical protein
MPWNLIAEVGLKLINLMITEVARKEAMKRQMLQFIKKFDDSILENAKLRREYDAIIKRANEKP